MAGFLIFFVFLALGLSQGFGYILLGGPTFMYLIMQRVLGSLTSESLKGSPRFSSSRLFSSWEFA